MSISRSRLRSYGFVGEGTANYQFAKSWQGGGTVRRGLEYVPEFPTPVLTSGVNARLEGRLTHRLTVTGSAGYSSGDSVFVADEVTLARDRLTFRTYTANVRMEQALSRMLAGYAEYLYYFYDVRGDRRAAPALTPRLERNGFRVGGVLRVPAFRR